jgi:hypothetical protein
LVVTSGDSAIGAGTVKSGSLGTVGVSTGAGVVTGFGSLGGGGASVVVAGGGGSAGGGGGVSDGGGVSVAGGGDSVTGAVSVVGVAPSVVGGEPLPGAGSVGGSAGVPAGVPSGLVSAAGSVLTPPPGSEVREEALAELANSSRASAATTIGLTR